MPFPPQCLGVATNNTIIRFTGQLLLSTVLIAREDKGDETFAMHDGSVPVLDFDTSYGSLQILPFRSVVAFSIF